MKFPRTVISIAAIAAAMISAAPGAVRADLTPNGHFVQSGPSLLPHLVGSRAASDFQVVIPRSGGSCAANSLPRIKAPTASANSGSKKLLSPKPNAAGPIEPVEGPYGLRWLCQHDEEAQQCICIPWPNDPQ
ncbi:MAG TPA: hypothetical protein VGQ35_05180 [Dongiaceae bacterium]|jgi:hypothetical protein|nr:hypothetical protein [Dongiaceae bacterium]